MSGITDLACRLIAKSLDCSLVYAPLVSAKALVLGNRRTLDLLRSEPAERPVGVQIFGGEPETIGRAAEILRPYPFDFIDINMGCPAPKVAGHAGGASLMRDPKLAADIMKAAVRSAGKPVTAKIRAGWDEQSVNAIEISARLEEAGASAIAIHPRTMAQGFAARADWNLIKQVKQALKIPVIGNGDVESPEDAARMFELTGCDLIMIGRAARGNPWIFKRGNFFLQRRQLLPEPSPWEKVQILIKHCTLLARYEDEHRAALKMRKHAGWYIKGLKNAANAREKINMAQTASEIVRICYEYEHLWHETCSS
jgi:tRNA-dihydrouridine synthase B